LRLDAAALAHSEGADRGFSDLRVIDAAARQVPYLVERSSEPLSIDLSLERLATAPKTLPPPRGTRTVYRWRPPFERLPSPRLVLTTSARVFQRSISIGVEREPNPQRRDPWIQTFAGATWVHADQDSPAPALAISLPRVDAKELFLIVEEGDNSPLPIGTARLLLPSYRLRFFREKGALLRLAYGRADLTSPRYDLALLAPQVFGTAATEVVPGAEQHGQAAAAGTVALLSPWIFWTCLGTAACVLLALIARLLRKGTA